MTKQLLFLSLFLMSFSVVSQNWENNFEEAVSHAKEEDKPIVLVFSGSDWCAPCIKLDKEIWQSERFKKYAHQHYVLYKADFPRKKSNRLSEEKIAEHAKLADRFNPRGHFPLVVVLNAERTVLGTLGYEKTTPEKYISNLNKFLR
ncbi:thioredoxin family protein [Flavobacteriaceae bacterium TP-CH-4]|uniref:Thioredoxin family protein n=1 Tax=Pelagihabitans pacificus TaxID=2696054 RepID=A0A967E415_9FLAO|nr:thioredoxin family protein [Pelagihabitans pacificus]NHF57932.1 thioredoxin family protein [Pelagihabitans pacificus]